MEAETEDNPKIKACKCEGSVKYIHFKCLKQWLESKMTTKNTENHHTLSWKQFECELCKMHFAYSFKYKGEIWNLVDWKRPDDKHTPYIILESLDIEKNSSRIIHTVMVNEQKSKFSLGRGHESDLRINDISVSWLHAKLEYKDGRFVLIDCRSKFGTLALLKDDVHLEVDKAQTLQIGWTVVTIIPRVHIPHKSWDQGEKLDLQKYNVNWLKMNMNGEGGQNSNIMAILPEELKERQ